MTIIEALTAMCYRQVEFGKWLKPVGCHLFTYSEDKSEWANWFLAINKKIMCGESHAYHPIVGDEPNDPLMRLKEWEAFTRISVAYESNSHFELSGSEFG